MLFTYHAIDQDGHERDGTIEAPSQEVAVSALQRRNLIISVIESAEKKGLFNTDLSFFGRVSNKDIVILSSHTKVFSTFYVNMVRAGEESGKLSETFVYLADYLDRNYDVTSKVENAL